MAHFEDRCTHRAHSFSGARLLRYAIRLLGAQMTESRPAGIGALVLLVASPGTFVQTDLAVSRHHYGGGSVGVAFGGGDLGVRQAHRPFRSQRKAGQRDHQQSTQYKAHDGISLVRVVRTLFRIRKGFILRGSVLYTVPNIR